MQPRPTTMSMGRRRPAPVFAAFLPGLALVLGALVLGACVANGPPETGLGRQGTWFSYVGGEDLRRGCVAGAPDRLRFVYQALYARQVRGYELTRQAGADVAGLRAQAWGAPALLDFPGGVPSLGAPTEARVPLSPLQWAAIEAALSESGFESPAPAGAFLRSDRYFWTVSACRGGRFHFNAFLLDEAAPRQPAFAAPLFALDRTGTPVRQPQPTGGPLVVRDPRRADPLAREDLGWQVRIGPDGLSPALP